MVLIQKTSKKSYNINDSDKITIPLDASSFKYCILNIDINVN